MDKLTPVAFRDVRINDGFWKKRSELNKNVTIYSVMERFKETGRFEAFKFNWTEGADAPKPHFFWDSDVAKWIESVAYILCDSPDKKLEEEVEELISLIDKHRGEDGYFNIYHTVVEPDIRFRKRDNHELYCLGHLIEAAIAYYDATGNDRLLNIIDDYIDYVIKVFCVDGSAGFVTPGHEEIELALIKLYRKRKEKKYLELAMFFLNNRGVIKEENASWYNSSYNQSHLPVREQKEAMGHCVRACYLYSAMADAAKDTDDEELLCACKNLFDDIINKKMYISGGIGSSHHGEAFTIAYDLPNDTAYAETCASISMLMFADRMKDIDIDSKYADIVELEMYNGILAGISLDGRAFFYENPLEINLIDRHRHTSLTDAGERFPITQRQEVFNCSCCPPNLTRFFASVGDHIFSYNNDAVFIHQFLSCTTDIGGVKIRLKTSYPANGAVNVAINDAKGKTIYIRIPGWCKKFVSSKNYTVYNGYAVYIIDSDECVIDIDFNMSVEYYVSSSRVRSDAGKVAVMYGPVLYCAESTDNRYLPSDVFVDCSCVPKIEYSPLFDANTITLSAYKTTIGESLYSTVDKVKHLNTELLMIPYFSHSNRGECDMAVWIRRICSVSFFQ